VRSIASDVGASLRSPRPTSLAKRWDNAGAHRKLRGRTCVLHWSIRPGSRHIWTAFASSRSAGIGQDDHKAYAAGHVPGATCWDWKAMLWDSYAREFPSAQEFARRLGEAGIATRRPWSCTASRCSSASMPGGHCAIAAMSGCACSTAGAAAGSRKASRCRGTTGRRPRRPRMRSALARSGMRAGRRAGARGDRPEGDGDPRRGARPKNTGASGSGRRVRPTWARVRAGRIPGAKHLHYLDLLGADERFKPVDEIRSLFEARGANRHNDILAYCRMSHRATVLYFAMTAAARLSRRAMFYDGSWTEWGQRRGACRSSANPPAPSA